MISGRCESPLSPRLGESRRSKYCGTPEYRNLESISIEVRFLLPIVWLLCQSHQRPVRFGGYQPDIRGVANSLQLVNFYVHFRVGGWRVIDANLSIGMFSGISEFNAEFSAACE